MLASTDCMVSVQAGKPPLMVVAGEINYESAFMIRDAFHRLQHEGESRLILDCGAVDFVDSSGIGAIVHCAQALRHVGGGLALRTATPQLVHALRISGLIDQLDFETAPSETSEVRQQPIKTGVWQQVELRLPMRADRDGLVRRRVTEMAETMPFTQEQIDDIRLAVGEAVSNAIRHGCPNDDCDELHMRCTGDSEKLVVGIHNPGRPFCPDAVPSPDPEDPREGGMGIFFMRSSMDVVEYAFDGTGTTVSMIKYIKDT